MVQSSQVFIEKLTQIQLVIKELIQNHIKESMESEKKSFDDAKFQAMLDQLKVIDPNIYCDSGNKISRICFNPNCKLALQCGEPFCKYCGINVHQTCPSFPLVAFTQILNNRTGNYKEIISSIIDLDNELISWIEESKKDWISSCRPVNLAPDIQGLVDGIYKNKSFKSLSGKEGKKLFEEMQEMSKCNQTDSIVGAYKEELKKIMSNVTNLKRSLLQKYLKHQSDSLDSVILQADNQTSKSQIQFLFQSLNKPKKIELLYRGSENDFSASAFHTKCGDVENTLTLIRTEFGKTLAGFTPYTWHSVPQNNYVSNAAGGCFILSLDLKEKLIPVSTNSLILNNSKWGPLFGSGNDMFISDHCNSNKQSGAGYITTYNTADRKYTNNQATYTALSGATAGYGFRVLEYEVFKVTR